MKSKSNALARNMYQTTGHKETATGCSINQSNPIAVHAANAFTSKEKCGNHNFTDLYISSLSQTLPTTKHPLRFYTRSHIIQHPNKCIREDTCIPFILEGFKKLYNGLNNPLTQ